MIEPLRYRNLGLRRPQRFISIISNRHSLSPCATVRAGAPTLVEQSEPETSINGLNIPFLVQARMNGYETLETWASSAVATGRALVFECKRSLEWMPFFNIS